MIRKATYWFFGFASLCLLGNLLYAIFFMGRSNETLTDHLFSRDVGLALFYFALAVLLYCITRYGGALLKTRNLLNVGLAAVSIVVALLLFELILSPFNLVFNAATVGEFNFEAMKRLTEKHPEQKGTWYSKVNWMVKDPQLGYRPNMCPNCNYSDLGALHNPYSLEKPPDKKRILFTGDSICALGFLSQGIREMNPDPKNEYWNTGVFGYGSTQELNYFKRYGRKLKPDMVILEFCLNDWDGTPVILKDETGKTIIANLYLGSEHFNPWLFKYSTLYRVYLSLMASITKRSSLKDDVKRNLAQFQKFAREDGFTFKVVVHPELDKQANWPKKLAGERQDILAILDELQIPYYDAAPLLFKALENQDRDWSRLEPNDHFHPSKAFGFMLAEELIKKEFLEE